jgi:hypothetical protein
MNPFIPNRHFQYNFICLGLFVVTIFLGSIFCGKSSDTKNRSSNDHSQTSSINKDLGSDYRDSCIRAAQLWLDKKDLTDFIDRFEKEQKECSEIDHSINYRPGNFNVAEISLSPLKYSVSYRNNATNAGFVISWIVDFTVRRVYANPNEYGYDKEGVSFEDMGKKSIANADLPQKKDSLLTLIDSLKIVGLNKVLDEKYALRQLSGEPITPIDQSFTKNKTAIYWVPSVEEKNAMGFNDDTLFTYPICSQYFTEDNVKKYILISGTSSPSNYCHACAPMIGGILFAKQPTGWKIEAINKKIAEIGSSGEIDSGFINQIGPQKYAGFIYSSFIISLLRLQELNSSSTISSQEKGNGIFDTPRTNQFCFQDGSDRTSFNSFKAR